jgi:hypothetical protein
MKVEIGLGTIVGYLLTTLGAAATAWAAAEGSASHLSPGLLAVLTVVSGTLTTLGRMYQAKTPVEPPPPEPTVIEAPAPAASPPEGQDTAKLPAQ